MAILPRSTYYDKHYRQAPALIRARRPFLVKNILTGMSIFGFAVGVYAFTIRAVAQDDFEDVPLPDAPVQMAGPPNASTVRSAGPATK